jgi:lipoyl(octanoyl) transferase
MTWRLILSPPADGADNMALDEALMHRARATGDWTFRVYGWSAPTLSLGRNQTARGAYRSDLLYKRGIAVVRRPTGGRAILHHREATYSVTGPVRHAGELGESYQRINRLLVAGLAALGVDARVVDGHDRRTRETAVAHADAKSSTPGLLPCFDYPSPGEIVYGARKLIGSAQWRCDGALLQHGSLLIDDDQTQIPALLNDAAAADHYSRPLEPATLRSAIGRAPALQEIAAVLFDAVRALEDPEAHPLVGDERLAREAQELRARYLDDEWTWRR